MVMKPQRPWRRWLKGTIWLRDPPGRWTPTSSRVWVSELIMRPSPSATPTTSPLVLAGQAGTRLTEGIDKIASCSLIRTATAPRQTSRAPAWTTHAPEPTMQSKTARVSLTSDSAPVRFCNWQQRVNPVVGRCFAASSVVEGASAKLHRRHAQTSKQAMKNQAAHRKIYNEFALQVSHIGKAYRRGIL